MLTIIKKFKSNYFSFYFTLAVFFGFTIPYLNSLGYNNTQTGFLMSILYFSGIIGQFVTGYICDLKSTIKKVFIPCMILLALSICIFFEFSNIYILMILIGFIGFFQTSVLSLIDCWVIESHNTIRNTFGPIRAYGSIGWGLSNLITGKLIDLYGWWIIKPLFISSLIIHLIICCFIKDSKQAVHNPTDKLNISSLSSLLRNKKYILLVFIFFLLYFSFHAVSLFSIILLTNFGGTKAEIGLYWMVLAFSEVPILIGAKKLTSKINLQKLLIISAIFFALRNFLTIYANSVLFIICLSILQMPSFSILVFISKYLVDEISPQHIKTSSQTIAVAASSSLAGLLSYNISGYLGDNIGIKSTLALSTGLTIIAIILSFGYLSMKKPKIN
ncbi:MFS transporter [Abyssisolibacter fermentans]|uniref:MFS transporter n=1 Tax=Abyssisolibacter fermentans TaxID=1766203 RepID=UPI0008339E8B|nr:MFS transporter [Abyssisolibacter fermentans]